MSQTERKKINNVNIVNSGVTYNTGTFSGSGPQFKILSILVSDFYMLD